MRDQLCRYLESESSAAIDRLKDFLRIPSISADPAYAGDIGPCAQWVAAQLRELGLETAILPTQGHPVVLAHTRAEDVAPAGRNRTVLFYGHYDVQPADPVNLWTTPAFEPAVRDGAVFARGASDDKGQVLCFIEALRAWRKTAGSFPAQVTLLIEGEEEIGSAHLRPFLKEHRKELAADIVVVSDTWLWDTPQGAVPAITYGMRGLVYFDVQLHGPDRDVHSGVYGNTIANPAVMLVNVLGRLVDDRGRVTIPGFYDAVAPLTDAERRQWQALAFDEKSYLAGIGLARGHGEAGYSLLERRWARPSCDINGLYGGYGGAGAKTIIPAFAGVKVSFRLAPNQNGREIAAAFEAWLRGQEVHGCRWKIMGHGACDPVMLPVDSPWMAAASRALEQASGRSPVLIRDGATVPVVGFFKQDLGLDSLLVGFGQSDDCIHSPNEKFNLGNFALGCRSHALLLAELARV